MESAKRVISNRQWLMVSLLVLALAYPVAAAATWIPLNPTSVSQDGSPSARGFHSAVYNPATNRMIVFGGCPNDASSHTTMINDLWVLTNADGTGEAPEWIKLNPGGESGPPAPRLGHSAVFDQTNNRMIVHGGQLGGGTLNDTWVLTNADGKGGDPAWMPVAASGPALRYHGAAYDAANNRMIIQGGDTSTGGSFTNDAWVLTNANGLGGTPVWTRLAPTTAVPTSSWNPAGYDSATNTWISYLNTFPDNLNQVWLLKNANGLGGAPEWAQVTPDGVSPSTHTYFTAVYDSSRNNLVPCNIAIFV